VKRAIYKGGLLVHNVEEKKKGKTSSKKNKKGEARWKSVPPRKNAITRARENGKGDMNFSWNQRKIAYMILSGDGWMKEAARFGSLGPTRSHQA